MRLWRKPVRAPEPPHFYWSMFMFRKRRTTNGKQGCCQTNEPKHQYLVDGNFYEITKERHSDRAASRLILNVLRFESDL